MRRLEEISEGGSYASVVRNRRHQDKCIAGKAHYMEVYSNSDQEDDPELGVGGDDSVAHMERGPPPGGAPFALAGGVLASLHGVPKCLTLRSRGRVQGQRVSVLVDSGATHNFIDAQMVQRRGITTKEFEGFSVLVLGDGTMQCICYVPALTVTMLCSRSDSNYGELFSDKSFLCGGCTRHQCGDGCPMALFSWSGHYLLEEIRDGINRAIWQLGCP